MHICTEESFLINAPEIIIKCCICNKKCKSRIGWLGEKCSNCDSVYNPFDITIPDIVRKRRELLGLTRKQMGELTGYSKYTIKQYEFVRCSKAYYNLTIKLINKYKFKISRYKPKIVID